MKKEEQPFYVNSHLLLRTLTLKSKFKFGSDPQLTVKEYLDLKEERKLLFMYYGLSKINFNSEVLEILKIYPEDQIPKPGKLTYQESKIKVYEMYGRHISERGDLGLIQESNRSKKRIKLGFKNAIMKSDRKYNKASLTRRNQGH